WDPAQGEAIGRRSDDNQLPPMKHLIALLSAAAALALSGCGQLDLTPEGDPSRAANGRIDLGEAAALPADTVVTVRVVDSSAAGMPPEVLGTRPPPARGHPPGGPGTQTLRNPGAAPIAFRVEYRAEDELLRRGLNIEVRISYGGRVRYFNRNQYALTLGNAANEHRITVNPTGTGGSGAT